MATSERRVKAYAHQNHKVVTKHADGSINAGDVVAKGSNDGEVATATSGDRPFGVALPGTVGSDDHSDGDEVSVLVSGVARVEADSAVNAGDIVVPGSSTDGAVDTASTIDAGTTNTYDPSEYLGKAVGSASAGNRVEVNVR